MKNKLIQISAWIAAHITLVVVLVTAVALFLPSSFVWIDTSAITPMLGVVMFGMGLTLRPSDFRPVLQHPKDILVGELAQLLAGMAALQIIVAAGRTRLRSDSRGMLSRRYGQQRHLLPGQRRCSPERGHDRSFYTAGSHRNACPRMAACRRVGGSRRGRHVFKYRTGGNSAHRTGSSCQSLLPTHHPTDSTVATDDFHLVHSLHYRYYRSTQRSQHPCMQPDSGRSGDSAQRTRTGFGIWYLLSCRK